jgi:3-hydroxyacyl-CoA dehydrogenase/enoyl-CoA hydratase/3-hydroxybutyryl-CoA epimerase
VRLEKRTDGVALILFDTPDSPVNILSRELFEEFGRILDEIESDGAVRACVLASGKPGTFIAGANLKQLIAIATAEEGRSISRFGQHLLDRIAKGNKPFVAAIHGPALGGGLEVALACHYRLAADDPKTVLGLPEVQLGLLPGAAGTQRLPRLIGLAAALPMLLTGKRQNARQAYRMGLVDALTSPGGLSETAIRAASMLADKTLAPRRVKLSVGMRLLGSALGRPIVFRRAAARVRAKTRGLYPAPPAILQCVEAGYARGVDAGLAKESELFGALAAGQEAKHLIGLFETMTALKKPRPGAAPKPVRRVGILGAGFMGSGIASVSLAHGPVTVKDISEEALARCARSVHEDLSRRLRSGELTRFQRDQRMARLRLTRDDTDLAGADIVIEAIVEDLGQKRRILAAMERHLAPTAVFASNTSALPIAAIAEAALHPERVVGMHYFSPVEKMPLLELVVPPGAAASAVDTARAFGILQGKTVVVVKDGPGFYTSRILSPYLNEATILLQEGAEVEQVDRAILDFGFPVGPLALLDEVGIDVAAHVTRNFGTLYADRGLGATDALPRLHDAGYEGRKNGRGFFRYDERRRHGRKRVNEEIYAAMGAAARRTVPAEQIASRLSLLMVNEAVYCLQEGVIACPSDGDVGAILGLGFPPFRGGPFRYVNSVGVRQIVALLEGLRDSRGPRFEPAPLLRDMARENRRFH